ncbi:hypothetical protein MIND_00937900 [Mycena indigotica]|uniref:Uncharacterized protein n=1 Tax=Mycena indigotica TaxID=2126181 RepID=A0A8H6SDP7_9AGAR|nr:uncharacterized protein MIND_00937900 [Mycena indigotica]KAF7297052.1 hypothetical protein MIND_00937900 [Mycena indigotica]
MSPLLNLHRALIRYAPCRANSSKEKWAQVLKCLFCGGVPRAIVPLCPCIPGIACVACLITRLLACTGPVQDFCGRGHTVAVMDLQVARGLYRYTCFIGAPAVDQSNGKKMENRGAVLWKRAQESYGMAIKHYITLVHRDDD